MDHTHAPVRRGAEEEGLSRQRMLRGARAALHVIAVVLTAIAAVRAASMGGDLVVVLLAAGAFLAWYGAGASFARGRSAGWWLVGLSLLWAGLLVISPEFVWLAFALLLLAGHVVRLPWSGGGGGRGGGGGGGAPPRGPRPS
ncbi:hypothetical protein, partial [Arenibacterium sp. S380]|uniref:hypothetical protein n=1 Tax=Arenibacterium sp. S380 TaxID=3415138 RepID=UPI003C7DBFC8